jgi:ADP-heptose:LPS heptosyltransferase
MRLLVIRTSAMGDVALTTPVLRAVIGQYPDTELVLLTQPGFKPFFHSINRLTLFLADLKNQYKGFAGLIRLYSNLADTGDFDAVIDLHDVLRSKILRILFRLQGVPVTAIKKGRRDKRNLISGKSKQQLPHAVERYCTAFAEAGFPVELQEGPWITPLPGISDKITSLTDDSAILYIGVAPYAKHKLKVWPEEYMVSLLQMLSEKHNVRFYLFGGAEEKEMLDRLNSRITGSENIAGILSLEEEIAMMSRLDLMIAMDSSNMHMAALAGVNVICVWGATDPLAGFGAWRQPEDNFIRIPVDELTCRPCTIYGKGECKRGDFACMNWLTPEIVFRKIERILVSGHDG